MTRPNFDLKAEIASYWDSRADTFDDSPSHFIRPGAEEAAWQAVLRRHLPDVDRPNVLELGCGTGLITLQLIKAGAEVTAVDLGERMLGRAREKVAASFPEVRFLFADAEDPFLAGEDFDAIVCRHLVWTLPDPASAFRRWHDLLKPGGKVLIFDHHADRGGLRHRGLTALSKWLDSGRAPPAPSTSDAESPYHRLQARLPFGLGGAPAAMLAPLLSAAGFGRVEIDPIRDLRRAQRAGRRFSFTLRSLSRESYLITATRIATTRR